MSLWKATLASPVGRLLACASDKGLRALQWHGFDASRCTLAADLVECPEHPFLAQLARELDEYFAGSRREFDLPLDPVGTEFQRLAWDALRAIPYGSTRSYREQAAAVGRPTAVRAIGAANGRNPIAIVVPCHRVIGSDGSLTGFAGGLAAKRLLLAHEAANLVDSKVCARAVP